MLWKDYHIKHSQTAHCEERSKLKLKCCDIKLYYYDELSSNGTNLILAVLGIFVWVGLPTTLA